MKYMYNNLFILLSLPFISKCLLAYTQGGRRDSEEGILEIDYKPSSPLFIKVVGDDIILSHYGVCNLAQSENTSY